MPTVLLASTNTGKLLELRSLIAGQTSPWYQTVQVILASQLGIDLDVVEDGSTYAENAALKANAFRRAAAALVFDRSNDTRLDFPVFVLSDDSGLEVDPLGGQPGVHSARYAPGSADHVVGRAGDALRRRYLLDQLKGLPGPWKACFKCTIAIAPLWSLSRVDQGFAAIDQEIYFSEGACCGEILDHEQGNGGFGYDPIFYLADRNCTMAELSTEEKNHISHRALALRAALPLLEKLVKDHQA